MFRKHLWERKQNCVFLFSVVAIAVFLFAAIASAATITSTLTSSTATPAPGDAVNIGIEFNIDGKITNYTAFVFFNSTVLSFTGFTAGSVYLEGDDDWGSPSPAAGDELDDTAENKDGDANTDKRLMLTWGPDNPGNANKFPPGTPPLDLIELNFTVKAGVTVGTTTTVNIVSVPSGSGHTITNNPVTLTIPDTTPPTIGAITVDDDNKVLQGSPSMGTITVEIEDNVAVASATYNINGESGSLEYSGTGKIWQTPGGTPVSLGNTTAPGNITITVTASDAAANSVTSPPQTVQVEATANSITAISGDTQSGRKGTELGEALVFKVTSDAMPSGKDDLVESDFSFSGTIGSFTNVGGGVYSVKWTLADTEGAQTLDIIWTAETLSTTFSATAYGDAAKILITPETSSLPKSDTTIGVTLTATVQDSTGNTVLDYTTDGTWNKGSDTLTSFITSATAPFAAGVQTIDLVSTNTGTGTVTVNLTSGTLPISNDVTITVQDRILSALTLTHTPTAGPTYQVNEAIGDFVVNGTSTLPGGADPQPENNIDPGEVDWVVMSGATELSSSDYVLPTNTSPTLKITNCTYNKAGTITVKVQSKTDATVKSLPVSLTFVKAGDVTANATAVTEYVAGATVDLANLFTGGSGDGITYTVTTPAGAPVTGATYSIPATGVFAGTYAVEADDQNPCNTTNATNEFTVPMLVEEPNNFSLKSSADAVFTIKGLPTTAVLTDPTGFPAGTTFAIAADNTTITATFPAMTTKTTFTATFQAAGYPDVEKQITVYPSMDISGTVKNAADGSPLENVQVTPIDSGLAAQTTPPAGTFNYDDLVIADYRFMLSKTGYLTKYVKFKQDGTVVETDVNGVEGAAITDPDNITLTFLTGDYGKITGTITELYDVTAPDTGTSGDGVLGALVEIRNAAGAVVASAVTDVNGEFTAYLGVGEDRSGEFSMKVTKEGYFSPDTERTGTFVETPAPASLTINAGIVPKTLISFMPMVPPVKVDELPYDWSIQVDVENGETATAGEFDGAPTPEDVVDIKTEQAGVGPILPVLEDTPPPPTPPNILDFYTYGFGDGNAAIPPDMLVPVHLTATVDVISDPADLTSKYAATRDYYYVPSMLSNLETGDKVQGSLNDIEGPSDVWLPGVLPPCTPYNRDIVLTIPPGAVNVPTQKFKVDLYQAMVDQQDAEFQAKATGSSFIYGFEFFDAEGNPATGVGGIEVSLAYDTTAFLDPNAYLAALQTGKAQIYTAPNMIDLVSGSPTPIPAASFANASVANGKITFPFTPQGRMAAFYLTGMPDVITLSPSSGHYTISHTVTVTDAGGTFDDFTATPPPTVTFGGTDISGDITATGENSFTFTAAATGPGSVPLTVTLNGHTATAYFIFTGSGGGGGGYVTQPPHAAFKVDGHAADAEQIIVQLGDELKFVNTSTGTGLYKYQWDFGDETEPLVGSTSDEKNPAYTYEEVGVYDVTLKVWGSGGQDEEKKKAFIKVVPAAEKPEADFTASATEIKAGESVTFENTTKQPVDSVKWYVDGIQAGSGDVFAYEFGTPGVYTVKMAVSNPGGSSSASKTITVTDGAAPSPVAGFTYEISGTVVTFTNTSENFVSSSWDFGDGTFSADESPVKDYGAAGTFTVTLTVTGASGATAEKAAQISVSTTSGRIMAEFKAVPMTGVAPLNVRFTNTSTATNGITACLWAFGDGAATSTDKNPSYLFEDEGTYTVSLTVSGPDGSDSASMTITVKAPAGSGDVVNPPVPGSPANGAVGVGLTPTLTVGDFSDPENVYSYTIWEIADDVSFEEDSILWREINTETKFTVPQFVLDAGAGTYYWRVRFVDTEGHYSEWSDIFRFTTVAATDDDADADGTPDDQDADDMASSLFPFLSPGQIWKVIKAAEGDGYWALEGIDKVADIVRFAAFPNSRVVLPEDTEMPAGLIGYKLMTGAVGDTATVKIHFSGEAPENALWLIYQAVAGWQDYSVYTKFAADGKSVTLMLEDGGFGDIDGIANGYIIVPLSGYGVPTASGDGGGGSDTCFIQSAGGGLNAGWLMAFLTTMTAMAVIRRK